MFAFKFIVYIGKLIHKSSAGNIFRFMVLFTGLNKHFIVSCCVGLVDMCVQHIQSPMQNARNKIEQCYSGPIDSAAGRAMLRCDPDGPLMIHTVKNYSTQDASSFHVMGRVFSGTITENQQIKILGEHYSSHDEEDSRVLTSGKLWIHESR